MASTIILKALSVVLLASLAIAEPPVQSGYNYNAPSQYRTSSRSYIPPSSGYNAPSSSYGAPSSNYAAPSSNYGAPSSSYHAPSPSYGAPSSSFSAPSSNYGAPSSSYNAPSSNYAAPSSNYGAPSSNYGAPGGGYADSGHGHGHDNEVPKSYEFGYSVKDAYSGNDYDRKESSDGNTVRGEYRVQLPDGRTQIVTYHADWQTGFHADVRYEGEAQYPEQRPADAYGPPSANQGYPSSHGSDFSGSLTGFQNNNQYLPPAPAQSYGAPNYHK